jgi:adenylate kinase family enzyme
MKKRIHIFGASGSGTSTIGKKVASQLGYDFFDTDYYYFLQTSEPFSVMRPKEEVIELMTSKLNSSEKWVLSGSLIDWGDVFIPLFDLVVFVYLEPKTRIERLKKREFERYGDEIYKGGKRYDTSKEFIDWAATYDTGTSGGRSLPRHEAWIEKLNLPVIRIMNNDLEASVSEVIDKINERFSIRNLALK